MKAIRNKKQTNLFGLVTPECCAAGSSWWIHCFPCSDGFSFDGYCCWTLWAIAVLMAIAVGRMLSVPKAGAAGRKDTYVLAAGSGSYSPLGSCAGLWLVDWLMIRNLSFELVAVAVGLAAIAVDFLNSLMIVCCTRPSTLDR